jgi:hypothetical protein
LFANEPFEPIARADNLDYGAKLFRVCHTPRRQSVVAGLPQYEEFIQCGPRDERPENGRLASPEWAEIFLADRQNSAQNSKYSTSCPKKMFSLRYNFFLKPRHS